MSPWVDVENGAERIGRDYVFSRKPSPALLAVDAWPARPSSGTCASALEACGGRLPAGVHPQGHQHRALQPQRLWEWADIAMRWPSASDWRTVRPEPHGTDFGSLVVCSVAPARMLVPRKPRKLA